MDLSTAINSALEGEALLFAGSGFSYGAKNVMHTNFHIGDSLRDIIATDCGLTSSRSLSVVSEYYVTEKSQDDLIRLLKNEFSVSSVAPWHNYLMSIQWKRIYTTNYDSVIELAAQNNGRILTPIVLSCNIADADINNVCIHLNGYINHLDKYTINNEFKLTDESYSCDTLDGNEWFELFKGDLQTAKAIIIIGYSMQFDINIKRLLSAPSVNKKVIFIDSPSPNKVDKRLLQCYGSCEFIGIEAFADNVKNLKKIFKPTLYPNTFRSFIHEYRSTLTPETITFGEINNLYSKGVFIDTLAQKNHGEYQYMILRNAVDVVVRNYLNTKVFLALSDLGNGKTMFCQLVRNELREHEVDVFLFSHEYNDCEVEIQKILSKKNRHSVVIIDNYKNKLNILKCFKYNRKDKITFVLTTRKSVNPSYRNLIDGLGITEDEIKPLYLDILQQNEIKSLSDIIINNKLYSTNMIDRTPSGIQDYIQTICHSHFADLLLDLYNSSDIRARISAVWENNSAALPIRRLAILALMKSVMGIDFNFTEMLDLLKIDYISLSAKENELLKEFFNFNDYDIIVKSSIVSRELLRSVIGISDLIDTMKAVIIEADKKYKVNGAYLNLLKNLVSHSHFRIFNNDAENQAAITNFYDSIRNLSFCNDNTFFWEQFATACIEAQDFLTANRCIENAFTIAKGKPGFIPFHIENIKANYLIEKLLFDVKNGMRPSANDAINILVECHDNLLRNINHPENNVSYTFRIGSKYAKIYEIYKNDFDVRQKSIFTEKKVQMLKLMKKRQSDLEFYHHPLEKWIDSLEQCQ